MTASSAPCSKNAWNLALAAAASASSLPLALVGPPLAGDVADDLGRADDVALVVLDRRDGERHQDAPAVLADALGLEVIDPLPGLEGGDDVVLLGEAIGGMTSEMWRPTASAAGVAEQPLGGVVPALDDPVQRLADDGVVGRLHDRRQPAGVRSSARLFPARHAVARSHRGRSARIPRSGPARPGWATRCRRWEARRLAFESAPCDWPARPRLRAAPG